MTFRAGSERGFDYWGTHVVFNPPWPCTLHCGKKQRRHPDPVLQPLLRKAE